MENKDQNDSAVPGGALQSANPSYGVISEPLDPNALSLAPDGKELSISQEQQPKGRANVFLHFTRRLDVMLAALLIIAGVAVVFAVSRNQDNETPSTNSTSNYDTVTIPLDEIIAGKNLNLTGTANVTINGPIQLNDGLYVAPTLQPTGAQAGQIYYDKNTNQLAYFNGAQFVFLTAATEDQGGIQTLTGVQSLGGADGAISVGSGLNVDGNQLSNSGVLSVQGQDGDVTFTAGPGIVINGTTFSNSGILSVASGSPNVTVANDGDGNVTLSVTSGSGTITSSGGTVGRVPLFTASQNIENSIITQSGLTVTITGDLSVVTGGLTLSNALTVSNGGTGTSSLATNGVLVGNGTAAVSSVAAGGAGLCLLSTGGAPTWGACPGGAGVTTLNGLSGAVNIANASAAGSTVTLDDATTSSKGIASFNGTNFTVNSGVVNTAQNIDTGATPTFVGVNTNTITPSGALTVGISAQTALLQGSTTTIASNGVGNDIILNSAAEIELQDNTNVTGSLTTSGDTAVNGGDITSTAALNITPGGTLTVGVAAQTLTLQGGAATSLRATSGANTTTVAFASPTANTTLNFPALAAGTYTICTTSGNCSGAAATLQSTYDNSSTPEIVLDATRLGLTIRDNASAVGGNLLEVQNNAGSTTYLAVTASGIVVTGTATVSSNIDSSTGALQTNGTNRIDNSGNAVNLGNVTLSGAISGGTTITASGNINSSGGALQTNSTTRVDNSGNLVNIAAITASGNASIQGGSVTVGASGQAGSLILSDGSSNTGTLQVAALGQDTVYTLPDPGTGTATICLTTGNCAGSGGGVTTGGGTTNRLPKFTGSQSLGDSSISDDGTDMTVSIDVIVQGGDLTVGSASQAASMILHDGNGQTTTLQAGNSAGNLTFVLPTNTGTANQCLKQSGTGNQLVWQDCDGGAGGSSATLQTAYNNSTDPEIVLNSSVGGLTIRDNSTPLGANLFEIQNNAGSTTYLAVTVSGASVTGTATATGNINSSGGALQTNGTSRIDNSGNAVNIGNITGSGAMTIASIGAGNDITVDGADQFIVQDSAVFNALTTFNANIDLGANDIIGTTSDINLTNFDVAGATGNVTAGTYNGQTISSSANFTGSITVATDLTLTSGDIAVNGGDITSTAGLNITPGGTLTVGAVGEQLILQGDANTTLTSTSGGFTTIIDFDGVPAANVTYSFDRAAAAGTYTICTTVGNCAGSGGGVTTSGGTTGTLPVFTGAQTLGDSLVSQSGGVVTVAGHLNLSAGSQYRINGSQISSANLSNDANIAKLNASQTFTGNTVAFQNGTNSTNAFNVQNAAGTRVLTVDTSNGQVVLGIASTLDGKLVFNNVSNGNTVSIVPGTPTGNRTLTLPDASGIICTDSGNCAGAGATLQTAYNFSVGGTTPKIKVDSTLLGVDIQDADTTIGANLFNIRASNGAGLGSVMFGVGSTGDVTLQNSANSTAAFRLLTQGGTSVLTGDTQNGAIILGQAGTLSGSLTFNNATNSNTTAIALTTPTSNRTITLPNATGTVCLDSGNCSGAGSSNTLQAAYDAGNTITTSNGRDIVFTMADTATDGNFLVNLECDTSCGSNGRFAVQDDGTDILTVAPSGTITAAGALVANGDVTLGDAAGDQIVVSGTIQGGSPFVFEGATADANQLTLSIATLTADRTITLPNESGTLCVQNSANCGFLTGTTADYIQNQNAGQQSSSNFWISGTGRADTALQSPLFDTPTAVALAIGTTNATAINLNQNTTIASGKTLTVTSGATSLTGATTGDALTVSNSTSTGNVAVFKDNTTAVFTIADGGIMTAKTTSSTSSAFVIQNGSSQTLFSTDTFNNTVKLVTIGRDNTSTYEAIWLQGSKNGVTAMVGGNDDTSAYVANDFSGDIRFNGSGVGWGDLAYYPNGGGNGNYGQFRFSTTGSALNTTPNAKLGIGDLYVNATIGVATTSPSYTLAFGAGANRTIGIEGQTTGNTAGNNLTVSAGAGHGTGAGGTTTVQGGAGYASSTGSSGGSVNITAGNAGGSGNNNGGNIVLQAGSYTGTGNSGSVIVKNATDGEGFIVEDSTGAHKFISVDTSDLVVDLGTTGTEASSSTVNIGTSTAQDQYVNIGSTASTSETAIRAGTGDILLQSNSSTIIQSLTDGADAFKVVDSLNNSILSVNTSTNVVSTDGLQVNGTFAGAGLTDCDAYNSKVLYDSTTKQFSCGTDKPNVIVKKAGDQTVTSSTALVNDDTFTFSVGANETWTFQINAVVKSDTTPDFKFALSAPASSTCRMMAHDLYGSDQNFVTACGDAGAQAVPHTDNADHPYLIWGSVATGATGGTVTFRWAQNTSNANSTIVRANGIMYAYKMTGADLAEAYYTKDSSITPGTVVSIESSATAAVKKSQGTYDSQAIGVVSTAPGQILSDPNRASAPDERPVLLALSGRIPVRVSLENGPIKPGDYLTTSSTPGVAMKATEPGQMIGKALEGFTSSNPESEGTVMTFANLTYANPNSGVQANTSVQNGTFGDLNISGMLTTTNLNVTGKATVGELVVGTMRAESVTVTGSANFGGDINLQSIGKSRNAITKRFIASKHIPIGAVVIIDPVNDGQVTTTTVMGDTRVLGVALTEAQAGGQVTVAIGGSVQVKSATGAVLQGGDLLVTSSQEGTIEKSATPTPGQMIGKALGKNESDGLVWVLISLN